VTDLPEAYCCRTIQSDELLGATDAPTEGWGDDSTYRADGLDFSIGKTLTVDGDLYGTVCLGVIRAREYHGTGVGRVAQKRPARSCPPPLAPHVTGRRHLRPDRRSVPCVGALVR